MVVVYDDSHSKKARPQENLICCVLAAHNRVLSLRRLTVGLLLRSLQGFGIEIRIGRIRQFAKNRNRKNYAIPIPTQLNLTLPW